MPDCEGEPKRGANPRELIQMPKRDPAVAAAKKQKMKREKRTALDRRAAAKQRTPSSTSYHSYRPSERRVN